MLIVPLGAIVGQTQWDLRRGSGQSRWYPNRQSQPSTLVFVMTSNKNVWSGTHIHSSVRDVVSAAKHFTWFFIIFGIRVLYKNSSKCHRNPWHLHINLHSNFTSGDNRCSEKWILCLDMSTKFCLLYLNPSSDSDAFRYREMSRM